MTTQSITNPLPIFMGLDGNPLSGGYVYIGQPNQDPKLFPASVYYDSALSIPATQPLRTSAGYVVRNGRPTTVWTDGGAHSLLVLDSTSQQVVYVQQFLGVLPATVLPTHTVDRFSGNGAQVAFNLSVSPASENDTDVFVGGVYQQKNAYSLAGNVLTFAVAPAAGVNNIEVNSAVLLDYATIYAEVTTAAASALASRAAIDNRIYPGTYAVAPATRPDGSAIQNGDEYFGTDGYTYVRVAGAWVNQTSAAAASAAAALVSQGAAAASSATATAQATIATTQAGTATAKALEASNYAAAAATGSKFYDTIALGRAAVADGATFGVIAGGSDGLSRATIYRREAAGGQTALCALVSGSEFDTVADLGSSNPTGYDLSGRRWALFDTNGAMAAQLREDEEKFRFHLPIVAASVETAESLPALVTPTGYELAGWTFAIASSDKIILGENDDGEVYLPGDNWVLYTGVVSGKTQTFSLNKLTGAIAQLSPAGSNNTAPFREGRYAVYTSDRVGGDAANGLYTVPLAGGAEIPYFCRKRLACWGDSQTFGTGAVPGVSDYPTVLGGLLGGWTVYNGGVAGETSLQIATRVLADAAHLSDLSIYKMGRNDGADRLQSVWNIRRSVEAHKAGAARHRFIVLSQYPGLSTDVARCTYLNAVYASMWPSHYCDVYAALLAAGNGSGADNADIAAGVVPTSLRSDTTPHLNAAGYAVEAQAIYQFIISKGWA